MKTGWIILIIIGLVVLFSYSSIKGTYNGMVTRQEAVTKVWADVQSVYQRRNDLIPNLVNIVKEGANFEQSTLIAVTEARGTATSIKIDPNKPITSQELQKFTEEQQGMQSTLSRLMVVVEKYPELKANKNFSDFQVQLEGSENRIATERRKFNEAAKEYNTYIKRFPNNIIAGFGNFEPLAYFEADKGADKAPKVEF